MDNLSTRMSAGNESMPEDTWRDRDELSLFALGIITLRNRWRIARWMVAGGALAALAAFTKPALYVASTSFIPEGNDPSRSGLASIAGQFGVALPTGNQSQSPDFYTMGRKSGGKNKRSSN